MYIHVFEPSSMWHYCGGLLIYATRLGDFPATIEETICGTVEHHRLYTLEAAVPKAGPLAGTNCWVEIARIESEDPTLKEGLVALNYNWA